MLLAGYAGLMPRAFADDSLASVKARGTLRWCGDMQGGPPYVFEDPSGKLVGFEVELADAIADELGVRAVFVHGEWANLIDELDRGSCDLVMNGMEIMPERAQRVLFSRPYYVFAERLMARKADMTVVDLGSLKGKRVGTLTNSLAWSMLEPTGATVVPYDGTDTPYLDLEGGRLDAVLLDDIIAVRFGQTHDTLRVAGDVGTGYYAALFRKQDGALRDRVNDAFDALGKDGRLRTILQHWQLDNERQAALVEWSEPTTRVGAAAGNSFSNAHVRLFLEASLITLALSVGAMTLAILGGLALALMRIYGNGALRGMAGFYVEIVRGTPVLLQLYLLYFGLAPWLALSPWTAAILGLGLNYAAYEAEVYRAGFEAVPIGQIEAATTLGMSKALALRRIVLPQALRISLPAMTNDFIALMKDTSLVSVIAVIELTKRMSIVAVELGSWAVPAIATALLYLAMSYPVSLLARRLERNLHR